MKAMSIILAGGAAVAALVTAAPAAAQYYPGYGYGYGGGGNVVGQVLGQALGGGYGYNNNGYNQQALINQCVNAVQARLSGGGYGGYGGYGSNSPYGYGGGYGGYGNNSPYGYGGGYGGGRVLGVSRIEPRGNGGLTIRGVATSGRNAGYGYGGQGAVDLTWKCKTDYRGYISDLNVDRAQSNYGYNNNYSPYDEDYSQYGYRRY